mmetsp:Transcript_49159/g.124745  ORF Transcript_49159/g.124745 Transcript_49159/m.124745 type:complete len:205 (+) Transcript_49159:588-1202(+)
MLQRLGDALPHLPDGLDLRGLRGHGAVVHKAALHGVLEEGMQLLLVVARVRARGLDEHIEGRLTLQWARNASPLVQHRNALAVQELVGAQDLAQLPLGLLEELEHILEGGAGQERHILRLRQRRAGDRQLGDDAQGALRADHELPQVGAGVVFPHLRHRVDDGAVRQDELSTQDSAVQRTVAQEPQATGVRGDVAANLARALGA